MAKPRARNAPISRPTLRELELFAAVAAHRSFSAAAVALSTSRPALSHAVIGLERRLGLRLLNRTTRSVSPTEDGARLLARLGPVFRELEAAIDSVAQARGAAAGRLRINATGRAAEILLGTVVSDFLDRNPAVELDLVVEERLVDIVAEDFDAGVRLADAVPIDMVAIPFGGALRFVAVAAPAYLAGAPPLAAPDDLHRHRCIRLRLPNGRRYRWEFSKHGAGLAIDVPGPMTLNNGRLMVEAARLGLGIAYVADSLAAAALASGALVTVLDDWCPAGPGLALYYPVNRYVPSALRAFADMLRTVDRPAP